MHELNPDDTILTLRRTLPSGESAVLVTIRGDGTMEYGTAYEPDAAARAFWEALYSQYRDAFITAVAAAAHMANRAYCMALGDDSQPEWVAAPEWQQSSARSGVVAALDPNQTPEKSHEAWLAQKLRDGWRYGPVKDAEQKIHPCMREYSNLSEAQRLKDEVFLSVVRAVAPVLGLTK